MPYKDTNPKDLLLLPDTYGFNMTTRSIVMANPLPLSFPPQHQWMEWFRVNMLDQWIARNTKILAIGTSANVMWEKLEGRNTLLEGCLYPVPGAKNCNLTTVNESWSFRGENVMGIDKIRFNTGWHDRIYNFMNGIDELPKEKEEGNEEAVAVMA